MPHCNSEDKGVNAFGQRLLDLWKSKVWEYINYGRVKGDEIGTCRITLYHNVGTNATNYVLAQKKRERRKLKKKNVSVW
jgi:hypothetical protein